MGLTVRTLPVTQGRAESRDTLELGRSRRALLTHHHVCQLGACSPEGGRTCLPEVPALLAEPPLLQGSRVPSHPVSLTGQV